jgi:GntP family permease
LLAHWTQTFMGSAGRSQCGVSRIFLLGAVFGKLMDDSGSVSTIASFMIERLGPRRAVLAVVLAGALVTNGGFSLFVTFFVLATMAHGLFRAAAIQKRLMPAPIALGTPPSRCGMSTLYELLFPAKQRSRKFFTGREFDPAKLGVDTPGNELRYYPI